MLQRAVVGHGASIRKLLRASLVLNLLWNEEWGLGENTMRVFHDNRITFGEMYGILHLAYPALI